VRNVSNRVQAAAEAAAEEKPPPEVWLSYGDRAADSVGAAVPWRRRRRLLRWPRRRLRWRRRPV